MEFGYLDLTTLLIQGSFFHSVLFLRSTKNAFIMQTKSTFFGQCIWSPRKIIQGRMTSSPWNICIVSKGKQLTRFASLVGVLACRGWASLPVWCACLSNSGLCLLAVWTVIRLVALFTFKVRVTGIWNLANAYRCSPFSSFLKGVEFLVLASEQVKSPAKIQNHDRQKQGVLITKYARIVPLEKVYVNCPHTPIAECWWPSRKYFFATKSGCRASCIKQSWSPNEWMENYSHTTLRITQETRSNRQRHYFLRKSNFVGVICQWLP